MARRPPWRRIYHFSGRRYCRAQVRRPGGDEKLPSEISQLAVSDAQRLGRGQSRHSGRAGTEGDCSQQPRRPGFRAPPKRTHIAHKVCKSCAEFALFSYLTIHCTGMLGTLCRCSEAAADIGRGQRARALLISARAKSATLKEGLQPIFEYS